MAWSMPTELYTSLENYNQHIEIYAEDQAAKTGYNGIYSEFYPFKYDTSTSCFEPWNVLRSIEKATPHKLNRFVLWTPKWMLAAWKIA